MATLFATSPGRVAVLPEDIPTGLIMAISGRTQPLAVPGRGSYGTMRAIVTDVVVEQSDDFQVTSTMSPQRFVFVFGRGVGNARIAGIAFTDACIGGTQNGLERVCDYFNRTRVSSSGQAYNLVLGAGAGSRWKILVHGMTITVARPEMRLVEFTIQCKAFS